VIGNLEDVQFFQTEIFRKLIIFHDIYGSREGKYEGPGLLESDALKCGRIEIDFSEEPVPRYSRYFFTVKKYAADYCDEYERT
jgi:hypothetical protein